MTDPVREIKNKRTRVLWELSADFKKKVKAKADVNLQGYREG